MTTVVIRTKENQLIEKLIIDVRYSQDDQAKAYTLSVIDEAIRDALALDAGTLSAAWGRTAEKKEEEE